MEDVCAYSIVWELDTSQSFSKSQKWFLGKVKVWEQIWIFWSGFKMVSGEDLGEILSKI